MDFENEILSKLQALLYFVFIRQNNWLIYRVTNYTWLCDSGTLKSDLYGSSIRVDSSLHWTAHFLQGTKKTLQCLSGHVVCKRKEIYSSNTSREAASKAAVTYGTPESEEASPLHSFALDVSSPIYESRVLDKNTSKQLSLDSLH